MMDNITDYRKIKGDMRELWKDTFHDSSRYIDIVFETYFTPDNIFVRYDKNRLIASLLCVPYEFQILTEDEKKTRITGMYLCGLATHTDYRRRGIMAELMLEAERSSAERGFDLSFLIPADSHLREYYTRKGYRNASFRKSVTMNGRKSIDSIRLNIYSIKALFDDSNFNLLEILADWCINKEKERNNPTIIHSRKDMLAAMEENENSFFLTDEPLDLKFPILAKVFAVVFPEPPVEPYAPTRVVGLYIRDKITGIATKDLKEEIQTLIVDALCKIYPGHTVELEQPCFDLQLEERGALPYAMLKKLQTGALSRYEDLTFEISLMLD